MTEKQKRFADEYLIDTNITQASIRAGCKAKTLKGACNYGSRLLKNKEVKEYIDRQIEKVRSEKIATAEEVMVYLSAVLRGTSEAEIVVVEGIGDGMSEAKRITKKPDERARLKAAELLGKRYSIFKDNIEVKGSIPIVICGEEELLD